MNQTLKVQRHEVKYYISYADYEYARHLLATLMQRDPHQKTNAAISFVASTLTMIMTPALRKNWTALNTAINTVYAPTTRRSIGSS